MMLPGIAGASGLLIGIYASNLYKEFGKESKKVSSKYRDELKAMKTNYKLFFEKHTAALAFWKEHAKDNLNKSCFNKDLLKHDFGKNTNTKYFEIVKSISDFYNNRLEKTRGISSLWNYYFKPSGETIKEDDPTAFMLYENIQWLLQLSTISTEERVTQKKIDEIQARIQYLTKMKTNFHPNTNDYIHELIIKTKEIQNDLTKEISEQITKIFEKELTTFKTSFNLSEKELSSNIHFKGLNKKIKVIQNKIKKYYQDNNQEDKKTIFTFLGKIEDYLHILKTSSKKIPPSDNLKDDIQNNLTACENIQKNGKKLLEKSEDDLLSKIVVFFEALQSAVNQNYDKRFFDIIDLLQDLYSYINISKHSEIFKELDSKKTTSEKYFPESERKLCYNNINRIKTGVIFPQANRQLKDIAKLILIDFTGWPNFENQIFVKAFIKELAKRITSVLNSDQLKAVLKETSEYITAIKYIFYNELADHCQDEFECLLYQIGAKLDQASKAIELSEQKKDIRDSTNEFNGYLDNFIDATKEYLSELLYDQPKDCHCNFSQDKAQPNAEVAMEKFNESLLGQIVSTITEPSNFSILSRPKIDLQCLKNNWNKYQKTLQELITAENNSGILEPYKSKNQKNLREHVSFIFQALFILSEIKKILESLHHQSYDPRIDELFSNRSKFNLKGVALILNLLSQTKKHLEEINTKTTEIIIQNFKKDPYKKLTNNNRAAASAHKEMFDALAGMKVALEEIQNFLLTPSLFLEQNNKKVRPELNHIFNNLHKITYPQQSNIIFEELEDMDENENIVIASPQENKNSGDHKQGTKRKSNPMYDSDNENDDDNGSASNSKKRRMNKPPVSDFYNNKQNKVEPKIQSENKMSETKHNNP